MRIAYVINSVEGGGAALPVPAVTGILRDHGAEVEVFALTRRDGRALKAFETAGLRTHVREGGEKDHLAAYGWLGAALDAYAPDLIWTSLTRATLIGQRVGWRLHKPVVSWQHNAFLRPANRWLLRASRGLSALWICDSRSVEALTARRLGIAPERLALWPLFAADPATPPARPWRPGEMLRLGSLGRLHPNKGYDVLIAALAKLRARGFTPGTPFEVAIAGEGAQRAALQAAADRAGLANLRLTGFTEDPRGFLAGLHLYLQPSRAEGLCIAAHEAMQAGLPVVATAVGELPYSVLDGRTGIVVAPGDADGLAVALADLLSKPEQLAEMGEAGRARVLARFGQEAFAAAGAAVFERLPRPAGDAAEAAPPRAARATSPARA